MRLLATGRGEEGFVPRHCQRSRWLNSRRWFGHLCKKRQAAPEAPDASLLPFVLTHCRRGRG